MTDQKTMSAIRREDTPAKKGKTTSARSARERRHLIRECEKRFSGRGNEDSEVWIRLIRESRTSTDPIPISDK